MGYSYPVRVPIGAAATIGNVLAGTPPEYMGDDVALDIYGSADIAGMSLSLMSYRGSAPGAALIPPGSSIGIASTVGKVKTNEDFIATVTVPAGSRLVLSATNPGAASNLGLLLVVH